MVESIKPLVLITGVTGYLASHVCFEFLKSGNFKVRGSVRDLPNKTELLKKIYGDYLT
jgi:nucleoside-diphosphate-sugar epimerase